MFPWLQHVINSCRREIQPNNTEYLLRFYFSFFHRNCQDRGWQENSESWVHRRGTADHGDSRKTTAGQADSCEGPWWGWCGVDKGEQIGILLGFANTVTLSLKCCCATNTFCCNLLIPLKCLPSSISRQFSQLLFCHLYIKHWHFCASLSLLSHVR